MSHRGSGCLVAQGLGCLVAQRGGLPRTLSTAPCSCRWLSTGVHCLDDLNSWGCENPRMSSHQLTVIRSSAACRMAHEETESGAFLHVMRGCYVRVEDTRLLDTPWRTWITVARARLLAVHALGSGDRVFVGASSLALEVFLCGRRIRTYTSGLVIGVGVSRSARFAQQGSSCLGFRCDGLLLHLLRESCRPLVASRLKASSMRRCEWLLV